MTPVRWPTYAPVRPGSLLPEQGGAYAIKGIGARHGPRDQRNARRIPRVEHEGVRREGPDGVRDPADRPHGRRNHLAPRQQDVRQHPAVHRHRRRQESRASIPGISVGGLLGKAGLSV